MECHDDLVALHGLRQAIIEGDGGIGILEAERQGDGLFIVEFHVRAVEAHPLADGFHSTISTWFCVPLTIAASLSRSSMVKPLSM